MYKKRRTELKCDERFSCCHAGQDYTENENYTKSKCFIILLLQLQFMTTTKNMLQYTAVNNIMELNVHIIKENKSPCII